MDARVGVEVLTEMAGGGRVGGSEGVQVAVEHKGPMHKEVGNSATCIRVLSSTGMGR